MGGKKEQKILPILVYAAVGLAGAFSFWQLATSANFGLMLANAPAYLLAIGGIAWGSLKFFNFDLVETVGEHTV